MADHEVTTAHEGRRVVAAISYDDGLASPAFYCFRVVTHLFDAIDPQDKQGMALLIEAIDIVNQQKRACEGWRNGDISMRASLEGK